MGLLADTMTVAWRNGKKLLRRRAFIFFSLFMPLIYLLLFTQLFSRFTDIPGFPAKNYLDYAAPGIILLTILSSAFQSGAAMVDDYTAGTLEKLLIAPISRSSILLGRIAADLSRMLLQASIILVVALIIGLNVKTGVPGMLIIVVTASIFGVSLAGISHTIALTSKNAETTFALGGFIIFPMFFLSTALVPGTLMPDWIQDVSVFNPLSHVAESLQGLALTGFDPVGLGQTYLILLGLTILTVGASVASFRRVVD